MYVCVSVYMYVGEPQSLFDVTSALCGTAEECC